MSFTQFFGMILAALVGALLLVWIFVSLAALFFALAQGDFAAAGTYALLAGAAIALVALAWWVRRRMAMARARPEPR